MNRISFLDGLRGWGAVIVVVYQVFCGGLSMSSFGMEVLFKAFIFNGPFAVCIFFIVSGFALSIGFLSTGNFAKLRIITYTRYLRLALPVLLACSVVYVTQITGILLSPQDRLPSFAGVATLPPSLEHLIRFSFWDVFFDYQISETFIGPLWTMSIELMGSALVLALIALTAKLRFRTLIFAAVALLFFVIGSNMSLFVFGIILADIWHKKGPFAMAPLWGAVAIAIVAISLAMLPWSEGRIQFFLAAVFVVGCILNSPIRDFLSNRISKWLGHISFPLYLIHAPVFMIVGAPLMQRWGGDVGLRVCIQLAMIALAFIAAVAFTPLNDRIIAALHWGSTRLDSILLRFVRIKP